MLAIEGVQRQIQRRRSLSYQNIEQANLVT